MLTSLCAPRSSLYHRSPELCSLIGGTRQASEWHMPLGTSLHDVHAYSSCMALANVAGDNDHRLLVASQNKRLKIFRGTSLVGDKIILDVPSALCTYYMFDEESELPAVAIASGACIFIYRKLQPYFKFTLPPLDIHPKEQQIWETLVAWMQSDEGQHLALYLEQAVAELTELRDTQGVMLTPRSGDLIALNREARMEFCMLSAEQPLRHTTTITCMSVLHKTSEEEQSIGCLVLGLEIKQLMILSPDAYTIIVKVRLPSVPAFMCCVGTYAVEYRVFIACRHSIVCTVKNGELLEQRIELEHPPCCMITIGKTLLVGGSKTIQAYSYEGKRKWGLDLTASVSEMAAVPSGGAHSSTDCFIAALANGNVNMYNQRQLITAFSVGDKIITGIKFGSYGREEGSLAIAYKSGGVNVRIMRRHLEGV